MDMVDFNKRAVALHEEFNKLKKEMIVFAETDAGATELNAARKNVVRKLRSFPGDITPPTLANVSATILRNRSK